MSFFFLSLFSVFPQTWQTCPFLFRICRELSHQPSMMEQEAASLLPSVHFNENVQDGSDS